MRKILLFIFSQILCVDLIYGWDDVFKFKQCYEARIDERMPLTIDNLIAIVEGYEKENSNTAPENIADALLYRYRTNGVIYKPDSKGGGEWSVSLYAENYKQQLDDKLLKLSIVVPEDTFLPREECSLHMMLSHSLDYYPHAGVDYIWENNYFKRKKRSYTSILESLQEEIADHPIEFGVIQTNAGPISGGLLLAGIVSSASSYSPTVEELIDSENLPQEMLNQRIEPIYGTTISGILAKAAMQNTEKTFEIGTIGMFGNCSACPRIYSLESNDVYHLTRAEIFGALDGFIIGRYLQNKGTSQSVSLSEILRMYYSDHGLYDPDLRACNRQNVFTKYRNSYGQKIQDQALYYMYAYQENFPDITNEIKQNSGSPTLIDEKLNDFLNYVISPVNSFIGSYSYDDPGYYRCLSVTDDYVYETEVDLVVVYSPSGVSSEIEEQLEYIGLTARRVGVGYHRSRLAVLNGYNNKWLSPMTNYSNIADYVCNYTTSVDYSGSKSQEFTKILDRLSDLYGNYSLKMKSDPDLTGRNSQVVLWNLPNSFDGDTDVMLREWNNFNLTFPDVTFIFVAPRSTEALSFLEDQKDDVISIETTSSDNPIEISTYVVNEIKKAPRMFYYAACDTLDSAYSSYNEDNHVYTTFVSPNFTTIIRIPPQNFHFSRNVKLQMKGDGLRVCLSRTSSKPSENDKTDQTYCEDSPFDYEMDYLCNRYLNECSPIYISVKGNSEKTSYCSDDYCIYPYQIEFEMTHDGMVCSSCLPCPTLLLFFLITFVIFFRI
ncbi:UNVERIFIED_CONTAM: hypothetical protein RMT77_009455 [Armadillidium vulgare]